MDILEIRYPLSWSDRCLAKASSFERTIWRNNSIVVAVDRLNDLIIVDVLAMTQVITFFCARFDKNVILDHIFFFSFSFSSWVMMRCVKNVIDHIFSSFSYYIYSVLSLRF